MIVEIHIDHLVIDGGQLRRNDGDAVAGAITGEIRRLFAERGRADRRAAGEPAPTALAAHDWRSPERLGVAAARIIHGEVTSSPALGTPAPTRGSRQRTTGGRR